MPHMVSIKVKNSIINKLIFMNSRIMHALYSLLRGKSLLVFVETLFVYHHKNYCVLFLNFLSTSGSSVAVTATIIADSQIDPDFQFISATHLTVPEVINGI